MSERQSRREFMGLAAASAAGLLTRPAFSDSHPFTAAPFSPSAPMADPDLVVVNAKVYTMDAAMPRAEAFAVSGGRIVAVGSSADVRGLARKGTPDVRRQGHDDRTGLHRLPQPRRRDDAAIRGARRESVRGGVRHDRQHRPEAARQGAADAGGHVGGRLFLRRHEGQGQAAARSRATSTRCPPSIRSSCTTAAATRRSTTPRRSQLAKIDEEHAEPAGRHVRSRRERRAERARHRSGARRVQRRRQAARRSPPSRRRSASATGSRTSRSSSCATD